MMPPWKSQISRIYYRVSSRILRKQLPRIFVVGDSISLQYAPYLEWYLCGRYELLNRYGVDAAMENLNVPMGANWGNSSMVRDCLQRSRILESVDADFALVNCGLHDIKRQTVDGACDVPLACYKDNLSYIIDMFTRNQITMIWVNTTPVNDSRHASLMADFIRFNRDCMEYNAAARTIVLGKGIREIDLYGFTQRLGSEIYEDHVHFSSWVRKKQGQYLAEWLIAHAPDC